MPMSDPGEDGDYFDMLNDEQDDEDEADDCGLMDGGQCSMAGTEHCDFSCPNRNSELFAGSKAWMKAHGSACEQCGAEIEDGDEPGYRRACDKCKRDGGAPVTGQEP